MDTVERPGSTVMKLALNVGNIMAAKNMREVESLPKEAYFDDTLFFEVRGTLVATMSTGEAITFDAHQLKRMSSLATTVSEI